MPILSIVKPLTRALLGICISLGCALTSAWATPPAPLVSDEKNAASIAVEAAKKYKGTEITVVYEAGLQALEPRLFSAPLWEKLTGIKVRIVEIPTAEMYQKILKAHQAGDGRYDAVNVIPSLMPDLVRHRVLEVLDPYVKKYHYTKELQQIIAVYRDNQMRVKNKIYGFPDDGDVLVLYYRTDLFNDKHNQAEFLKHYAYPLTVPKTWSQFDDVAEFFTKKYAPKLYGAGSIGQSAYIQFLFQERFRNEGGQFFDPKTMQAKLNTKTGHNVMSAMRKQKAFMPPGVETWSFVESLNAFLAGDIAMTISWPPFGRWAAGYGVKDKALDWVPKSKVKNKVGYALPPGGHPQLAIGFSLSLMSSSKQKQAAYLFIQWLNSEEISLKRVQLPYALRDPFRYSHIQSSEYKKRWPQAKAYLDYLEKGAANGLLDLSILNQDKYDDALRLAMERLWEGDDIDEIIKDANEQWNKLTSDVGVNKQRSAYLEWMKKPNAYPKPVKLLGQQ